MGDLLRDFRFAVRSLRRTPGLALVIVLSLGFGIGAMATAYTWIDSFLLRPFPAVKQSDRLFGVFTKGPDGVEWSLSYPTYLAFRGQIAALDGVLVHTPWTLSLKAGDQAPERVFGEVVSGNFFDVLGVHAEIGRTFRPDEEAAAVPVVVLSRSYWERRFQSDPSVVGRTVLLNGQGFSIVGVAPSGFGGTEVGLGFDLWLPVTTIDVLSPGSRSLRGRGNQWLQGVARLKSGATLVAARAELESFTKKTSLDAGDDPPTAVGLRRLADGPAGRLLGPLFYTLFGLGSLILLIACANVANLLLARSVSRYREVSLRLAIGAGRARIVRQLLTESLILAVAGGLAGLCLAYLGRNLLMALLPPLPFPVSLDPRISVRVIGLASGVSLLTAFVFGLLPALRASRPDLLPALKDGQVPGSSRSRLRSALVVAQVAFALVALVAAGLFVRSAGKARNASPGFTNADHLLVADTDFHLAGLADSAAPAVRDRLLAAIRGVPGVVDASLTTDLPMSIGNNSSSGIEVEGYPPAREENMSVGFAAVGAGYFEVMGISIRQGRGVTETDRVDAAPVTVVNEAFAKRFWPGRAPIGRRIRVNGTWRSVIGVVDNVKMESIGETPYPYLYYPHAQYFQSDIVLVVQSKGAPMSVAEPIRKAFASVNSNLPMLDARSMRENMAGTLFVQSTGATLLSGLGVIALGLAAIGLFAVLSYLVGLRRREIGIRIALGAGLRSVVGLVLRQAGGLVGVGLAVGIGLAFLVARLLQSQLFGVSPGDPVTYGAIVLSVMLVGLVAAALPAKRAASVDPVKSLRSD